MKSLKSYIVEQFQEIRINDLELRFKCMPQQEYIKFHLPEAYSEDDFLIYIQDMYFNDLPASDDNMEKFFGKNSENIYDVLFEYDKYEKGVDKGDCVEWDSNIDNKHNPDDEEFTYVQVKGLTYVIKFDHFDMQDETNYNVKETLLTILNNITSHNNEFPLELKLDENNIKYKE